MDLIVPPPLGVHTGVMEKSSYRAHSGQRITPNRHCVAEITGWSRSVHRERPRTSTNGWGLLASGEVQEVVPGRSFDVGFPRLSRRDLVRSRDCQPTFLDHD
jgi:hypothetical protein